jgi:glutamine amidotransferase
MIAILKYNGGNAKSIQNALRRLGYDSVITNDKEQLQSATKVILPGVGEAGSAMAFLKQHGLDKTIVALQQPVLGICLGLQLLCRFSEESETKTLGVFDVAVKKFPLGLTIPHTGWNNLLKADTALFNGINATDDFYFIHSFYAEIASETIAECDYGLPFTAALQKGNFYAVQFHPEKSGTVGEQILKNFLSL